MASWPFSFRPRKSSRSLPVMALGLMDIPEIPAGGAPPTEFRIFPWGKHTSEKGEFVFDEQSAKEVLAAFDRKGHLMSGDYEHNGVKPAEKTPGDGPTPASMWFKLEVRGKPGDEQGGLFAVDVKWTPRAAQYVLNREYRHYSPAFLYDEKTRRIVELINVALTNTPAQHDQHPLVAAKDDVTGEEEDPPMKTLLALMKLGENASEADIIAKVEELRSAGAAALAQLKDLTALSGKTDPDEAKGVFAGWKQNAEMSAKLAKQAAVSKKSERRQKVLRLVKQAMRDKKIDPASKKMFVRMGMQKNGLKQLRAFIETAAPKVGTGRHKPGKDGPAADVATVLATLTEDEKKIARDGGVSYEDFAKTKARMLATGIPSGADQQ